MSNFAPKRILCPVDLSSASNTVLSWARLVGEVFRGRVEVIHADWPEELRYFTEGQLQKLDAEEENRRRSLEDRLQGLVEKVLGSRVPHSVSVVEGHAIEVILKRLTQNPPDLVI